MELKEIQYKKPKKTRRLNLKTTKQVSEWMAENQVSPKLLFDEAVKELMEKKQKKKLKYK